MRKRSYDGYGSNKQIDDSYTFQFYAKIIGAAVGVGAVIGALAGLGLSFTALSPLVIGGIVGAVFPALLALVIIGLRCYYRNEVNEAKSEEGIVEKHVIAAFIPPFLLATIESVAVGVCLAATVNAVLPGVFATWWAIAAGAGVGAIALPAGIITGTIVTAMSAKSLFESDEHVIRP